MNLLGFVLIFAGFALLALAMERHLKQICPGGLLRPRRWRIAAVLLLIASLVPEMMHYGVSIGITVWFGMATFAVLMIGLLLSYRPQWLGLLLGWLPSRA